MAVETGSIDVHLNFVHYIHVGDKAEPEFNGFVSLVAY